MSGAASLQALTAWRTEIVQTREELEAALDRAPRQIVVEGNELLRAHAAMLAYGGAREPAGTPPASRDGLASVPAIGRITGGMRRRAPINRRPAGLTLTPGLGPVLLAVFGLVAALLTEWLTATAHKPMLVKIAIPALAVLAVAAFAMVAWLATGLGQPAQVGWRVKTRVQGRLVLARVRTIAM